MNIVEEFKNLDLCHYAGTFEEDALLIKWWLHLLEIGEISKLFRGRSQSLYSFIATFQPPSSLIYRQHDGCIELAVWLTPFELSDDCVYFSAWVDPHIRGTKTQAHLMQAIYRITFEIRKTIVGITKQKALLPIHRKIGYTVLGRIPRGFDGDDGYIMTLTKEAFDSGGLGQTQFGG